jgi:hypothetical protein
LTELGRPYSCHTPFFSGSEVRNRTLMALRVLQQFEKRRAWTVCLLVLVSLCCWRWQVLSNGETQLAPEIAGSPQQGRNAVHLSRESEEIGNKLRMLEERIHRLEQHPAIQHLRIRDPLLFPWLELPGKAFDFAEKGWSGALRRNVGPASATACAQHCFEHPDCRAAIFGSGMGCGHYDHFEGVAQLPHRYGPVVVVVPPLLGTSWDASRVSKFNRRLHQDFVGSDLACYSAPEVTTAHCAALCELHQECVAYSELEPRPGNKDWTTGGCCIKRAGGVLVDHPFALLYLGSDLE